MEIPENIQGLCQAFLNGLIAVLGGKLYGFYLYGAVAFPGSDPAGDLDFHVILTETLIEKEHHSIHKLHAALASDFPLLGSELDAYYILLEEARQTSPPTHQLRPEIIDNSWALHRAHTRAGRCFMLHGPDPKDVFPPATWRELESALKGELKFVEEHLTEYPDYCILNLCRLMYSFETRDVVVSKTAAAKWAHTAFPRWRRHIECARRSYARQATIEDREFMLSEVKGLFDFAGERIQQQRDNSV
ncbi:MAG: DUF4111 domain-containing protein [Anaerolineaceae bacterium]|nr:DUF4111 domain-containing protein [Anaerolineaceae bacterium]